MKAKESYNKKPNVIYSYQMWFAENGMQKIFQTRLSLPCINFIIQRSENVFETPRFNSQCMYFFYCQFDNTDPLLYQNSTNAQKQLSLAVLKHQQNSIKL